eukprot:365994-Chlamydomonas_euryale.AAC.2
MCCPAIACLQNTGLTEAQLVYRLAGLAKADTSSSTRSSCLVLYSERKTKASADVEQANAADVLCPRRANGRRPPATACAYRTHSEGVCGPARLRFLGSTQPESWSGRED